MLSNKVSQAIFLYHQDLLIPQVARHHARAIHPPPPNLLHDILRLPPPPPPKSRSQSHRGQPPPRMAWWYLARSSSVLVTMSPLGAAERVQDVTWNRQPPKTCSLSTARGGARGAVEEVPRPLGGGEEGRVDVGRVVGSPKSSRASRAKFEQTPAGRPALLLDD